MDSDCAISLPRIFTVPVAHMQRISAGNCAVKAVCIRLSLLAADVLRCGMPSKSASASMPAQATAAGMLPCLRALRHSAAALLQVTIVQSSPDALRSALLAAPCAVAYTPPSEHFSIVPLPAMAAECPVLACNSSGAQRACHTIRQDGQQSRSLMALVKQ